MRTAIVCDWLVTIGGAEKFLGHLLDCFPNAELFAVIDFIDPSQRDFLKNKLIHTSFMQKLPFIKKYYRSFLPLMPLAIEQLDLSKFDLIISSSHAVAKGVITGPDQMHISYVHTPMRYAWDLQHQYLKESGLDKKWNGYLARYFLHKLRVWDISSANGVDFFLANSKFIAQRILKTYRRKAHVIYPPIDLSRLMPSGDKEAFYLTASRLVPYKKVDLIVETFKELPNKKLIVIGRGPDFYKIKSKASENVIMMGYQDDAILINFLQKARAFIFAAEEDFGLLPLEAQACGTPVIAYGKGGALETVRGLTKEKPTGVFFAKQDVNAIADAISLFEENEHMFTIQNCTLHAALFSPQQFQKNLKEFVNEKLALKMNAQCD